MAADEQALELRMDPSSLYREETFTDRRIGVIRMMTPVKTDGSIDLGRVIGRCSQRFTRNFHRFMRSGEIDAIFDEGVTSWFGEALDCGLRPLDLGQAAIDRLEEIGWRRATLPASRFPALAQNAVGIDFSGWALYTRASLPDEDAARLLDALAEREADMPWEEGTYQGLAHLGQDTDSTPLDVPLHPAAERWYREHGESME